MNAIIINNLKTLLAAVEAQPESQFDLSFYKKEEACGTLFCTIGLAATMPHFQALGYNFKSFQNRSGGFVYFVNKDDEEVTYTDITDEDFGDGAFEALFAPASRGTTDEALGYEAICDDDGDRIGANLSDKELAVKRLENRISFLEAGGLQ